MAGLAVSAGTVLAARSGPVTGQAEATKSRKPTDVVSVRDFGAKMDGTDETRILQAAINSSRGKTLVIPDGQIMAAGVTMLDASYSNTTIIFHGELLLKPMPPGSPNFGGAWVGLIIGRCDGVRLVFRGHGNRARQPAREHIFLVGIAGATNLEIPSFRAREIRGDGLYISQSDWLASSANPVGINIGVFEAYNSEDDGRNALSIISGENISIGTFRSFRVGGTINGMVMPGGLDVELDHPYQSVTNLSIGSLSVVTSGASGLGISGKGGGKSANVVGVSVGSFVVKNTSAGTIADEFGTVTQTNNHCLVVGDAVRNLIAKGSTTYTRARGDAVIVMDCQSVHIQVNVQHVREGARIGSDTGAKTGPVNSSIHINADDIGQRGIRISKAASTRISGRVSGPVKKHYSTVSGVYLLSPTMKDVVISVDVEYSSAWTRTYRQEGTARYENCAIRDCAVYGPYSDWTTWVGDAQLPRINVQGITEQSTLPKGGTWARGTFVRNTAPSGESARVLLGWVRLSDGNGTTLGVDWSAAYAAVS
ncbi:Pectate lyase superfamily protein domain-containing protein [Cupriavidus necator]